MKVKLTIFDILGREVDTIINHHFEAGKHKVKWNAGKFASGLHYYRLQTSKSVNYKFEEVKKLLLLK